MKKSWNEIVIGIALAALSALMVMGIVWIGGEMFPAGPSAVQECATSCTPGGVKSFNTKLNGKIDDCECYPIIVIESDG